MSASSNAPETTGVLQPSRMRHFEMLASAIALRELVVMKTAKAEPSYCDGRCIFVDVSLADEAMRQVVILHAALTAAGSLEPRFYRALRGRPGAARRYFSLEASRVVHEFAAVLPPAAIAAIPLPSNARCSASAASLQKALNKREIVEELAPYLGTIRPFRMSVMPGQTTSYGKAGHPGLNEWKAEEFNDDDELDASGDSVLKKFMAPIMGSRVMTDILRSIFGAGKSPAHDDADKDDSGGGGSMTGSATLSAAMRHTAESAGKAMVQGGVANLISEPVHWHYPEWDTFKKRYRPDWVKVSEIVQGLSHDPIRLEVSDIRPAEIRRQLQKVGLEIEGHRGQPAGDDIDLDAMISYGIDAATGHTPSGNIYRAARRTRRDTTVLVLLDISQSTDDRLGGSRSIFGQHREAARHITHAFAALGDRVALYGFHSWGRALTRLVRVKGFHEPARASIDARLDSIRAAGLTRIGAAIRHSTYLLKQETSTAHRLLLIISDGFAYDDQYEGRYAEDDTRRSLEEARETGVACMCMSIGSSKDDEGLKRVYGDSIYLRTATGADLVGRLRRLMNLAIHQASIARPRGHQRPGGI